MGAWGTYPKDSDGALDLFGDICDVVNKIFEATADGYGGYEYAGAVMLLLQKGFHLDRKIVEKAKKFVEQEMKDTADGKSGWNEPNKAIESMKQVIKGMDELLTENKKSKQILAPLGWLERKEDREKTNWSGLGFVH